MGFEKILRFLKRKKEKPSPFQLVEKELKKELGEDTQPYIFNYDLSYTNEKVVGVCALFEGKLYCKEEKQDAEIKKTFVYYMYQMIVSYTDHNKMRLSIYIYAFSIK